MMKRLIFTLAIAGSIQLPAQVTNQSNTKDVFKADENLAFETWINPVKISGDFILFETANVYEVKIYDMNGGLVKHMTTSSKVNFKSMNLSPGKYLVRAKTAQKSGKTVFEIT